LRKARNYGKGADYDCEILGLNARMTEFQAALCREGLTGLPGAIARRNRIAQIYEAELGDAMGIRLQQLPSDVYSGRKDFAILVDTRHGVSRQCVEDALAEEGIETRRYFDPPLHEQRLYRQFYEPRREPLTETMRASRDVICLPIHRGVTERDAERIASVVCKAAVPVTVEA
jgi:dTDP-4-amino-4,6-dideoxygalactose transaminase